MSCTSSRCGCLVRGTPHAQHALGMAWQGHQAVPSTSATVRHMGSLLPVPDADASPNQRDYDAQRLLPPWAGHEPTSHDLLPWRETVPGPTGQFDRRRAPGTGAHAGRLS
jgi:hypothetical protein